MNTLRFILFAIFLTGCSESQSLLRLTYGVNSEQDADEMNKKHDDYMFMTYSIFTEPGTSEYIHSSIGPSYYIPTLLKLPVGQTYEDKTKYNGLFKVLAHKKTILARAAVVFFTSKGLSPKGVDSLKKFFADGIASQTNMYTLTREPSMQRYTNGNSNEYFADDGKNGKLIQTIRAHQVGDIFTFDDEPQGGYRMHYVIKKLQDSIPATETVIVKVEKLMEDMPLD